MKDGGIMPFAFGFIIGWFACAMLLIKILDVPQSFEAIGYAQGKCEAHGYTYARKGVEVDGKLYHCLTVQPQVVP